VAIDATGNLYVADSGNHVIRKISSSGLVSTLAGKMGETGALDGTGTAARFRSPEGVAVDGSGNVYVADTGNGLIRKITAFGKVTTVAGAVQSGAATALGRENFLSNLPSDSTLLQTADHGTF
jgi:sugar lactone lactonase YvrE